MASASQAAEGTAREDDVWRARGRLRLCCVMRVIRSVIAAGAFLNTAPPLGFHVGRAALHLALGFDGRAYHLFGGMPRTHSANRSTGTRPLVMGARIGKGHALRYADSELAGRG